MGTTLVLHVSLGIVGLIAGYAALYSTKGAPLHRKAGMLFVYAMIPMAFGGLVIAAVRDVAQAINIPAALITAYLVLTSLITVRPPAVASRWVNPSLTLVAAGVAVADVTFLLQAIANGGTRKGMPAFPFIMFALVAVLGVIGDVRVMRSGPLQGPHRIARHLWRMTFALFVASLSFFIGQAKVFPEPIRRSGLLALPVLAVLVTMFVYLWRVRRTKRRGQPAVTVVKVAA